MQLESHFKTRNTHKQTKLRLNSIANSAILTKAKINGMSQTRVHFGLLAGLCASLSSLFGKLMSETDKLNDYAGNIYGFGQILNPLLIKITCLVLMVTCNALVWTFFVKALHQKGGSVVATVTSAATNYAISALLGLLIFGETTSLLWWFGTSMVIMGVVLMATDQSSDEKLKTT